MRIVIDTEVKRELGVSFNEYAVLDLIYCWSIHSGNDTPGWCSYKQSEMQEILGLSKRGLARMVNRLLKRGLLEKSHDNLLSVTQAWIDALRKSKNITNKLKQILHLVEEETHELEVHNNIDGR